MNIAHFSTTNLQMYDINLYCGWSSQYGTLLHIQFSYIKAICCKSVWEKI